MSIKEKKQHSRLTHLGELTVEQFLSDYWQKKPLYIKHAFPNFEPSITPDELAGFSLDDDAVSRLIIETPHKDSHSSWSVEHGPIDEKRFSTLPKTHWTLLIQHADQLDPGINELLTAFRFIPNWRLDDIMVSYATDCGGVGPHFDYFDVFLLQASGKRRWRLGQKCDAQSSLVPDQPMKILKNFEEQSEFICEPGDLIYIPANLAHWGEAIDESMTYSIGFRAPSDAEFLLDFSHEVSQELNEDQRYSDPELTLSKFSGEISNSVILNFKEKLKHHLDNDQKIAKWLAYFSTQNKNQIDNEEFLLYEPLSCEEYELLINTKEASIKLANYHRCAYLPHKANESDNESDNKSGTQDVDNQDIKNQNITQCFINGDCYECTFFLAQLLSSYSQIDLKDLSQIEFDQLKPIISNQLIEYIP